MNFLWAFIIIISFLFSIATGNVENLNNSIFSSISDVTKLMITLVGNMCFWCGIINIIKNTKIKDLLLKILKPFLKWLYPDEKNNEEIMEDISVNTISNILGIGNAATPAGLSAIEKMQKNNKNKKEITNSMIMLIVLNTTSIQLIPTTAIAIRASLQSKDPSNIIFYIWISTFAGTIVGILITKLILRKNKEEIK